MKVLSIPKRINGTWKLSTKRLWINESINERKRFLKIIWQRPLHHQVNRNGKETGLKKYIGYRIRKTE